MKATLEFNLPEEKSDHEDAVNGANWRRVVELILEDLRERRKYDKGMAITMDAARKNYQKAYAPAALQTNGVVSEYTDDDVLVEVQHTLTDNIHDKIWECIEEYGLHIE
tara:strand:+ start:119860 stop:120186 length:327 start_codon:yes stop_codon:yes gene_type:complete